MRYLFVQTDRCVQSQERICVCVYIYTFGVETKFAQHIKTNNTHTKAKCHRAVCACGSLFTTKGAAACPVPRTWQFTTKTFECMKFDLHTIRCTLQRVSFCCLRKQWIRRYKARLPNSCHVVHRVRQGFTTMHSTVERVLKNKKYMEEIQQLANSLIKSISMIFTTAGQQVKNVEALGSFTLTRATRAGLNLRPIYAEDTPAQRICT